MIKISHIQKVLTRLTSLSFKTKSTSGYELLNLEGRPLVEIKHDQEGNNSQETVSGASNEATQTWANGLRGLAAFLVMIHHSIAAFNLEATVALKDPDGTVHFWQWPILRAAISSDFLVQVFFVLSGYVLSYRPLYRLSKRPQKVESVHSSLASACLRRIFRLLPPPVTAVMISHIILLGGGFDMARAKEVCSSWTKDTVPRWITSNWREQTLEALKSMVAIWYEERTKSEYDAVLWTMPEELRGSMYIYLFLLATSSLKRRFRVILALALALVNLLMKKLSILPFISGIFMAELHISQSERRGSPINRILVYLGRLAIFITLMIGLFFGSIPGYPTTEMKSTAWSSAMFRVMSRLYSQDEPQVKALYTLMGSTLAVFAISQWSCAKKLLSTRSLQFLGRISFSLYVIHVPLLLSGGISLVWNFRHSGVSNTLSVFLMLPFWIGTVIIVSLIMTKYIDEKAVTFSHTLERYWRV
ncbi:uncharacterized protein MELLADRAFT_90230 [Melampsora larici-populina 98AG31]|uniref:Acyltransferase 3 domain-containing protein n=1 Tax=Melampsora larici-populina (strain 98AG31 / pathotype 3-4-7) TaxID=747676 RepID=F4RW68_MELLP|nr:uncharacterized protein MELLADRAFT_90230 [Melampsora larici-populina 98AG31]EGG03229.1 hypothetical protein MELLADRAFT_90230 [Melampsora larici-populina 98AG31]